MKKVIAFLLALAMVTTFTACGAKEDTSSVGEEKTSFAAIKAADCYENAGYIELISGAEASAEYTFTAENCETTTWSVYVFDEAFDDGFRYIAQAAEPILDGNGTISVEAGQFVYVYCSANEFTGVTADENAQLNVTVK